MNIAFRYSLSRENRHRSKLIMISAALVLSLVILLSVISIMKFLEVSRFEKIRNVKSFDIVVRNADESEIRKLYPSASVFSYSEERALCEGSVYTIRYVTPSYDGGIIAYSSDHDILFPPSLFLKAMVEGEVSVTTLSSSAERKVPIVRTFSPTGSFTTELTEFSSSLIIMDEKYKSDDAEVLVAVKGEDDTAILEENGYEFVTWKEMEASLYSAFILERVLTSLVLSVLILIVLIEIKHESEAFLAIKRKERASFILLGKKRWKIRFVFTLSFILAILPSIILTPLFTLLVLTISERVLSSYFPFFIVELSFPAWEYIIASCLIIILVIIFCLFYMKREEKKSILEIIYG